MQVSTSCQQGCRTSSRAAVSFAGQRGLLLCSQSLLETRILPVARSGPLTSLSFAGSPPALLTMCLNSQEGYPRTHADQSVLQAVV